MNNLKKFATEAEYSAATLNYPAVSWVTATDNVHFDKSGSTPTVNDKVMIASYGGSSGGDPGKYNFYNCEASSSSDITAITLDDVAVEPIVCQTESHYDASQLHIAKYDLSATTVGDWCSGDLGCMEGSNYVHIDILYPSQITSMQFPNNIKNMVVEAETPPYVEGLGSAFHGDGIYVPDSAVNTYKSANEWGNFSNIIHPISEYQGNIPID